MDLLINTGMLKAKRKNRVQGFTKSLLAKRQEYIFIATAMFKERKERQNFLKQTSN